MSELDQIKSEIKNFSDRLDKHEDRFETSLSEISESLQKISEVMIKQEVHEQAQKVDREDINQIKKEVHELDKKAVLSAQSEENIKKTADEIKDMLKGALKWGAGIFATLIIVLVVAAIKAFSG